jgi:hypothetical protein
MDKTNLEIPKNTAIQLCTEIRQKYQGKWWTLAGIQCMGCTAATKGDLTKRCVSNAPGYHGCNLVNARYDRQPKKVS